MNLDFDQSLCRCKSSINRYTDCSCELGLVSRDGIAGSARLGVSEVGWQGRVS